MNYTTPHKPLDLGMTNTDFSRLSAFIYKHYGIKLPLSKKLMLEGRLHKRLKLLNLSSYKAYCDYVFSEDGQQMELIPMMDLVTTNKTDFFREAVHFNFLFEEVLPVLSKQLPVGKPFRVWSAGCSTGEEPYTLAMVLSEYHRKNTEFDYQILGTDISTRALNAAVTAVYQQEKVTPVPLSFKQKYLLKSKDPQNKTVRIVPELRSKVNFERLNFIEDSYSALQSFDAIFCRNVLIYFDRQTQESVIQKLCLQLKAGGFLFLGHSESVAQMDLPLVQIRPTIFRKV
ncbi:CheR family methyltransferase [Mucilaginibacter lacusdianchii]|uniref:CheR family methyltransferase n=1 Tax=Mucilaginibacter lacusdianchii TaxID=2684211 RepID=UPI00131EBC57|nr:protein-glutamate O-methyltransferase [Mucilaginibacter sp. JXJ CY 39]